MKKFLKSILVIAAVAAVSLTANARTSYRGFFDLAPSFIVSNTKLNNPNAEFINSPKGDFTFLISTTHGVQLNRSFFVGAGFGVNLHGDNTNDAIWVPVYAAVRWDLNISKKISPFVSCKLGYSFSSRDGFLEYVDGANENSFRNGDTTTKDGFFYQPTVGVRFRLHHHIGLNVGVTLLPTDYETELWVDTPANEFYPDGNRTEYASFRCLNLGFTIGIEF